MQSPLMSKLTSLIIITRSKMLINIQKTESTAPQTAWRFFSKAVEKRRSV